jgi:predicted HAD superfamily phosphohydrolase YqeG
MDLKEYLNDKELDQVMEITGIALDRASSKGFIADFDDFELSIKAHINSLK